MRMKLMNRGGLWALAFWLGIGMVCQAQLPGMMADPPARDASPAVAADVAPPPSGDATRLGSALMAPVRVYQRFLGPESPYRALILTILTLLILLRLKRYLGRKLQTQVEQRAFEPSNVKSFMRVWDVIWKYVITVLVIMAMTGSLRLLGLTAGFFGMILGWSLQQPVTGIAAWLMIIFKKPFRIGDRVIIAGITGDVTAITLTHVILNQVGGSVSGEERSGRGILIPNAILFQHMIINYTLEQKYMLDEVPVRLTFDSDWERAKEILLDCAGRVTADIIRDTGQQPFIRAEFLDWGVLIRLRYQTIPEKRQELSTLIVEQVLLAFRQEFPRVKFAMPSTNIRHRPDVRPADEG